MLPEPQPRVLKHAVELFIIAIHSSTGSGVAAEIDIGSATSNIAKPHTDKQGFFSRRISCFLSPKSFLWVGRSKAGCKREQRIAGHEWPLNFLQNSCPSSRHKKLQLTSSKSLPETRSSMRSSTSSA
jgi:hypothetical protein